MEHTNTKENRETIGFSISLGQTVLLGWDCVGLMVLNSNYT